MGLWRLVAALALAAVACDGSSPSVGVPADVATPDAEATLVVVPRASCEAPVGGDIEMTTETAYEATPGYDEALAALDLTALPETLALGDAGIIQRMLIAYMLEIPLLELPDAMARDAIAADTPMGPAVLGAFAVAAQAGVEGVDLPFLRRGLHRFYQCDRGWPLKLADFEAAVYDYWDLPTYEVCSVPKNLIRRVRDDHKAGVYVAQTLEGDVVRETEILMTQSRTDGAIDFIAYDGEGDLIDRGEFVAASGDNVPGAVPYACIACHFETGTFLITELFPSMDPVAPSGGCQ